MAFREIANALIVPAGSSDRYKRLNALDRLLDNSFFEDIAWSFEQETRGGGHDYLPLTERRPSVKFNLARIVIDESSGSLWADDEMAKIVCGLPSDDDDFEGGGGSASDDAKADRDQKNVDAILTDCQLDAVMMEAYERSASGSGAIVVDVDSDGQPTFTCLQGKYVCAHWESPGSQKMVSLEYVYPTTAKELRAAGYGPLLTDKAMKEIADSAPYWARTVYSDDATMLYNPLPAADFASLGNKRDDNTEEIIRWVLAQADPHDWKMVNAVYLRCLLFGATDTDGRCPFDDIADIQVEVARILSQTGRGVRYAADPLLVRERGEIGTATKDMTSQGLDLFGDGGDTREIFGPGGEVIRSVSNVIEGKARLLEMTGSGLKTGLEYADKLREWALEVAGAMKADAATAKGAMSGRALDLLQQMLRLLVKRQRIAYGQRGLLPLVRLLLSGCANGVLDIEDVVNANSKARMRVQWPRNDADEIEEAETAEKEARAKFESQMLNSGVLTVNEVRDRYDLKPVAWGDVPYIPGKGPWTGGSALGAKPDDEAAVPADDIGATDGTTPPVPAGDDDTSTTTAVDATELAPPPKLTTIPITIANPRKRSTAKARATKIATKK